MPLALVEAAPPPAERTWVPTASAAALLGISERAVRKACAAGRYVWRGGSGGSGGRRLEVALDSLPEAALAAYRQSAVGSGQEAANKSPEPAPPADRWEAAREVDRATAARRLAILTLWRDYLGLARDKAKRTLAFAVDWNTTHEASERLSRATLYRWDRLEREQGRAGLLPGYASGPQGHDLPPEIQDRFHALYLNQQRLRIPTIRQILIGELRLGRSPLVDQVPSSATLRRYARTLPAAAVTLAREGPTAFRRQHEPYVERDYTQIRVMQVWISDHAQFDFFARDEAGKPVRPWLTLWLDQRSRRRVGWCVHAGPSQDTVLAALAAGILRFGVPEEAYTDNGRDYSSLTLSGNSRRWRVNLDEPHVRAMTEHLGIIWHFSIPLDPRGKGGIERTFGVDRERFDKLFGSYCGATDQTKPEQLTTVLADPKTLPTILQVQEAYGRYVEEVANELPHEGQGMAGLSPRAVFEAGEYIRRTTTREALRLMLMKASRPATVQRNGVWAFERWYWSEAIAARHGEQLYYRYDLADLSIIHLFTLQDQYLCSVERKDLLGAGAKEYRKHLHEKQATRRLARAYQVSRDRLASAPDALAAMAAAARGGDRDSDRDRGEPKARPVLELVQSPLNEAARAIEAQGAKRRAQSAGKRARKDIIEQLAPLAGAGAAQPSAEQRAERALEALARSFKVSQ